MEGISVEKVSERDTSKSCSCCGRTRDANRVERGLYVCDECETVANADVNGAENIRQKVSPSSPNLSVNRSNGWLAQPSTFLFNTYDRDYFEGNYYLFMVSLATQATGASEAVGSTAHSMANNLGIQWRTR